MARTFFRRVASPIPLLYALLPACGGPAPGSAAAPVGEVAPSVAAPSTGPSQSAAPAPSDPPSAEPPRRQRPLEVHNACLDVVTVVFADDPKAKDAGRRTIAGGASIEGPRDAGGNQTVWLVDGAGEGLVKVHVTRGMKRVEIGRSCRTLDAR